MSGKTLEAPYKSSAGMYCAIAQSASLRHDHSVVYVAHGCFRGKHLQDKERMQNDWNRKHENAL